MPDVTNTSQATNIAPLSKNNTPPVSSHHPRDTPFISKGFLARVCKQMKSSPSQTFGPLHQFCILCVQSLHPSFGYAQPPLKKVSNGRKEMPNFSLTSAINIIMLKTKDTGQNQMLSFEFLSKKQCDQFFSQVKT